MRIFLFSLSLVFNLLFYSCGDNAHKAASYCDSLVILQQKVSAASSAFLSHLNNERDSLKSQSEINKLITELEKTSRQVMKINFEEDSALKESVSVFIDSYQDLAKHEFMELTELMRKPDSLFNYTDSLKLSKLNKDIQLKSKQALEKIKQVQREFAMKYKLQIEKADSN